MADVLKTAEFYGKLLVTETLDVGIDEVTNLDHTLEISSMSGSLKPSTTTPATKVWKNTGALVASAATIDLTALVRDNLPDVNLSTSSLKVQGIIFRNNSTTGELTIAVGAANGYEIFGDASGQVTLPASTADFTSFVMMMAPEGLDDVAAADKDIDLSSTTDATASYDVIIVAG